MERLTKVGPGMRLLGRSFIKLRIEMGNFQTDMKNKRKTKPYINNIAFRHCQKYMGTTNVHNFLQEMSHAVARWCGGKTPPYLRIPQLMPKPRRVLKRAVLWAIITNNMICVLISTVNLIYICMNGLIERFFRFLFFFICIVY